MVAITLADVLSWGPCYDEAPIRKWWGKKKSRTALEVLWMRGPNDEDKLEIVLRPEVLGERPIPEELR